MLHRDTTNAKLGEKLFIKVYVMLSIVDISLSTVSDLQNLLQLESQYGTLQGTTAAIDQVLEYLQKVFACI